MKIISHQFIRSLNISHRECVDWIYESFSQKHEAQLPTKISVHPVDQDFFTSMPCLLRSKEGSRHRYFGVKEVHRIEGAIPSLGSDMMLYDANTGKLLALIDCDWITTMRTGAVAAVSAAALRKREGYKYGFIGLGNTARATLLCVLNSEPNVSFHVKLLRYKDQTDLFLDRFKDYHNVQFSVVNSMEELLNDVDVLISCITSACGLLVEDEKKFKPGITIIPVHMRGFQNCDTTFDRVFGDDVEHIKGFQYFSQFKDFNEIGEVLSGHDPGRITDEQRIIDYNYGLALHDVVFASKIYEKAMCCDVSDVDYQKVNTKFWI